MYHKAPKKALQFLRWFCHEDFVEEIEGDLIEIFESECINDPKKANRRFTWNVIRHFRPEFIKPFSHFYKPISCAMFKSYFKTGWRNLSRNQGYSFINIGGLAIGMAAAILISLWVYDELSFNKHFKNYENIGRIWVGQTDPETSAVTGDIAIPYPVLMSLKKNYSHYFKRTAAAWWIGDYTLTSGDKKFIKTGEFIEPEGLEMFSLKMLNGSYTSLDDPHSIILSQSTARAIFGNDDPMNKTVSINNRMEAKVTGVYEDIPRNNHFSDIGFFSPWALWVSVSPWIREVENNWASKSFSLYVELQPNVSPESVNAPLKEFYKQHLPPEHNSLLKNYQPFAQVVPMKTWHLFSEFVNGKPVTGRISFVWLFGIAGLFVLLLACINFINLCTARSEKRARESGIRKVIGSLRSQLVSQYLTESFIVVFIAFVCSIVLVWLCLPAFNNFADKHIQFPFTNPLFWVTSLLFMIFTSLMAGLYPAVYLSSFQPVKVLKRTFRTGRAATLPRKILVVFQFSISVMLIIGTVIVYQQIAYTRNRPVGYDRAGLISVLMSDPDFQGKQELLRHELKQTGYVEETAYSNSPLTFAWNNTGGWSWTGKNPDLISEFTASHVSENFGKAVKWKIIAGRDFNRNLASDSSSVIINASAASYMHLKDPIGQWIVSKNGERKKIIGIAEDIIMGSPYEPVKQTIFFWNPYEYSNIIMRLKQGAKSLEALNAVEKVFKTIVPEMAFDYKFTDDEFAKKFSQEERIGKLSAVFAVLAIMISCLGLFGLASYVAEQRTKEIGIRKVLGASVSNLWRMLSGDFVMLAMISCLIAIPLSWYFTHNWLQGYQYRTEISWWIFLITAIGAVIVTLITVSYQAIKVALTDPVKSLKSE